ncbi:hypothetical protein IKF73_02475 [Candidatus Saccharibacteria bacterium]|nr:hypothetical protein [Candidatus Saccharibacteria bacterium]
MDNTFNLWLGVIVIAAIGTIAHFLYDWTHQNKIIGLFAAVNESTWEHIKIALTPTLLWGLYDGYLYGPNPNYYLAKLASLLVLVFFIPAVFYSYQKISKRPLLLLDVITFYLAIILSQLSFYAIIELDPTNHLASYLSCIGLFIFFGCYMTLTLEPLRTTIFRDPITNRYGFRAHSNLFKRKKQK